MSRKGYNPRTRRYKPYEVEQNGVKRYFDTKAEVDDYIKRKEARRLGVSPNSLKVVNKRKRRNDEPFGFNSMFDFKF